MTDEATVESLRVWDGVAPGWEKHQATIHANERPLTDRMLEAIAPRDGDTILELTAGPGQVGLELAETRKDLTVIVSDFAPGMVETAQRAAKDRGIENVEFRVIDAQAIELEDESIDGVISRFGMMILPDPARGFSEVRRVLKPGRMLAYAVWGPLETNPWMMMLGATLMQRGHFTPPPGRGFFPLTTEQENREVLAAAGFEHVEVELLDYPHRFDDFERYWGLSLDISGPLVAILKGLSEEELTAIHDQVREYSAAFRHGERYEFPSRRIFVRAS